jgi:2-desacetyl-2-hydroxyethyl bacteriochlorophyllide A dehydrogenase
MRASAYEGARRFTTVRAPVPSPGPDEALLRVRRVGICGTDLHIYQGHLDHRIPRGGVIGHETLADVVTAPPASGFVEHDRVVVEPLSVCGECRACRIGASYLCYHLRVRGVELPGGMQEYWAVPAARLLRVPAGLDDDTAALIEPLAVAVHDVRRAGLAAGDRVLVVGGGPIGALVAMVCRDRGAHVVTVELNQYRLDLLKRLGLETAGPETDVRKLVREWTDGVGVDVAFEVTGSASALRVVTDAVRVWGTVSIVGIHAEPVPVDLYAMFARELTMHGSRLYTRADWEEALRLAAAGALTLAPLVSRRIPLDELGTAMEATLNGAPVMKVLVDLTAR